MLNLLKIDLKRLFGDKLFKIAAFIAIGFAVANPLLYKILFSSVADIDSDLLSMSGITAKSMFFSSFAPGNNIGLIAPILIAIVLCKDFSFGTLRNKIICGKSRTSIFLSFFVSCAVTISVLIFLHAALTLGVSLLFFDYQATAFDMKDFGYLITSLGLELLVYILIAALVSFLCVAMKNAGLAVVLYVAVNFFFTIIGSIISLATMFINPSEKLISDVLIFLDKANIFMGSYIGNVSSYEWSGLLAILVGTIGGTALFVALGILSFKKKDLK